MNIKPIKLGVPQKYGVLISVNVLPFNIEDKTCGISYEIKSEDNEVLASGNIVLTEEQFDFWGYDNNYLYEIALETLELEKDEEITTDTAG